MTFIPGPEEQKAVLSLHLEEQIKSVIPNMKKTQVDEVLKFVNTYFGQDMHGQTDKAEFRSMVERITEKMQGVKSDETD